MGGAGESGSATIPEHSATNRGAFIVTLVNAQCRLAARPVGLPQASDRSLVEDGR
jgi:hypothetical protein